MVRHLPVVLGVFSLACSGGDAPDGDTGQAASCALADSGTDDSGAVPDHAFAGNAYELDLVDAKWNDPEGFGDILAGQLTQELVVGVVAIQDASVWSRAGFFEGGAQDHCTPTVDFPEGTWDEDGRAFEIGPADTTLTLAGYTVPVSGMEITGEITQDGTELEKGRMQAELDARDLGEVIGDLAGTEDPGEICGLLEGFGVACKACSSDGAEYCVEVDVSDMLGELLDDPLACVAVEECHPECSSSTCDDPSEGVCD